VATRFDGLLIMLQSVSAELDESIELLKKREQEDRAEKIFEELLDEPIRLLHYFKLASKSLEPFNTPTLHLVGM
jgi:NTP pyrophosphatase (non-canonical NTP hydrolase)